MSHDVSHRDPLALLISKHTHEQLFQLRRHTHLLSRHILTANPPKQIKSVLKDTLKVLVVGRCLSEWEIAENHGEEEHAERKDIGRLAVEICFPFDNLWGLVAFGTGKVKRAEDFFGEAEISDFDAEVLVDQNVLKLDIQVAKRVLEVEVVEALYDLLKEVPSSWLGEPATLAEHVEKVTGWSELHDKVLKLFLIAILLLKGVFTGLDSSDQIWVVKFLHDADLILDHLLVEVMPEKFDGEGLLGGDVPASHASARTTLAELFVDDVIVTEGSNCLFHSRICCDF